MYWYTWPLIFAVAAAGNVGDNPKLKWSEKQSFRALKTSLTSGLVRDFQFWKINGASRQDYSNGVFKDIRIGGEFVFNSTQYYYGLHTQSYPITFGDEEVKVHCEVTHGSKEKEVKVTNILLDAKYFEYVGPDQVGENKIMTFHAKGTSSDLIVNYTMWAYYNNSFDAWVPVKYVEITYNTWFGYIKEYNIYNFYNFNPNFSDDVFYDPDCHIKKEVSEPKTEKHNHVDEENLDEAFEAFKRTHDRNYDKHSKEHALRKAIFKKNFELVRSRNSQNLGYKLAINQFSDRTEKEMFRHTGLISPKQGESGNIPFPYTEEYVNRAAESLPKEHDLRLLGLVGPVMDQGECGCCWSVGITAAVEGALARVNGGTLISLSNQALIDCAWTSGAYGCDGSSYTAAYQWMMQYGLPTVEEYGGYTEENGYCTIKNMTKLYPIRGFTNVTQFSVNALKVALVEHGPLAVGVTASDAFKSYSGGIFFDPECKPTTLNHLVTLVGYGEQDGETFWILKNSWGTTWGIDGYIHISTKDNVCGVATQPTYVVI